MLITVTTSLSGAVGVGEVSFGHRSDEQAEKSDLRHATAGI